MNRMERTVLALLRAPTYALTVQAVEDLTAHCRRIHFHSPELLADHQIAPTFWLRLWIPVGGEEYQRAYTVTQVRRDEGLFASDFVRHDPPGPASQWAYDALPGQTLQATVYTGKLFTLPEPRPNGYLLIGDPASLPAISDILRGLPDGVPAHVLLDGQHDDDDQLPVPAREHDRLQWTTAGKTLEDLVDSLDEDLTSWQAWIATETSTTRQLRTTLQHRGLAKTSLKARGYWIAGKPMGRATPADSSAA